MTLSSQNSLFLICFMSHIYNIISKVLDSLLSYLTNEGAIFCDRKFAVSTIKA